MTVYFINTKKANACYVQCINSLINTGHQEHVDRHLSLTIIKSVGMLRKLQVFMTHSTNSEVPATLSGYLTKNARFQLY